MPTINIIDKTYKHFRRYTEILSIIVKYGFSEFLSTIKIDHYIRAGKQLFFKVKPSPTKASRWVRFRLMLIELGPAFVKLGQLMSNRQDLFPEELLEELCKLQDEVPPFPEEESIRIIETELNTNIETIFKDFQKQPVASASVSQVHKAVLKSGEVVAVKVQRPLIKKKIEIDLEILYHLAKIMERNFKNIAYLNPVGIVKEFEKTILKELDFCLEAENIERFKRNFEGDSRIYVPKIYNKYTTQLLIIMEFISGRKISSFDASGFPVDNKTIASNGMNIIMKQIFNHGFFHADPHPGNIMILKGNVICFLDYGMMGLLTKKQIDYLRSLIIGLVYGDAKSITTTLQKMSYRRIIENSEEFEFEIAELLEYYTSLSLRKINIGDLLTQIFGIMIKHRIKLFSNFILLIKSIIIIEGVARQLVPDFNAVNEIRPFVTRLIVKQYNPLRFTRKLYQSSSDLGILIQELPTEARDILDKIKYGNLRFNIEHRGLEPAIQNLNQMTNRLIYAMVLASLIIGSSILMVSELPPLIFGVSLFGSIGYLFSGILSLWLLWAMIRHRRD